MLLYCLNFGIAERQGFVCAFHASIVRRAHSFRASPILMLEVRRAALVKGDWLGTPVIPGISSVPVKILSKAVPDFQTKALFAPGCILARYNISRLLSLDYVGARGYPPQACVRVPIPTNAAPTAPFEKMHTADLTLVESEHSAVVTCLLDIELPANSARLFGAS